VFIDQTCPSCRTTFQVPDRLAGKRIRCKTCREEFRVTGAAPADVYDDEPGPRRRRNRSSSPLVPLLIVVGIVAGCLLVAAIVVVVVEWSIKDEEGVKFVAVQGQPLPMAKGPNQNRMPAAALRYPVRAIRAAGRFGRPANPPEGPIVVTLSNPRRMANAIPGQPAFQVDYQIQDAQAGGTDWYYLVVKGTATGEANLLTTITNPQGTLSFVFFAGFDPGQKFDIWVEREPFGKSPERKRVSKPVTLD
jgi:hypothetical protein